MGLFEKSLLLGFAWNKGKGLSNEKKRNMGAPIKLRINIIKQINTNRKFIKLTIFFIFLFLNKYHNKEN